MGEACWEAAQDSSNIKHPAGWRDPPHHVSGGTCSARLALSVSRMSSALLTRPFLTPSRIRSTILSAVLGPKSALWGGVGERLLGDDGHPRRAKAGEDPPHSGLVLEWVYGSIVSTAEKARDGAKRALGMQAPTASDANQVLLRALDEHLSWETRARQCRELLNEMLKSRLEAGELTRQGYDLRPQPTRTATALAWRPPPWLPPHVANASLLALAGLVYTLVSRGSNVRPPLPLRARAVVFYCWLLLNAVWFVAGIRERDFSKKPRWLKQSLLPSAAQHFSEPTHRALRLSYGIGMAACQPLLANLFLVLLPVDRTLFLLSCLGAGHEDGVLAHALCGSAVWAWATLHALLTQAPMLAAGLWSVIALPPMDGTDTKGLKNFMGLLAWLLLCGLGASSLAPIRRRLFNAFQFLHIYLFGAVLLLGCLHDGKVFWYGMLGMLLYGADLVQRWALRRRATVPRVSAWEWHPYSVAAHDDSSFALVVKAGGDWERRLRRLVAVEAAAAGGGCSAQLEVVYEGLYGTPDLQAAAGAADRVLLFAGGAGITPIASVLQSLLLRQQQQQQGCQQQQQQSQQQPRVANGSCVVQNGGCPWTYGAPLYGSAPATAQPAHPPEHCSGTQEGQAQGARLERDGEAAAPRSQGAMLGACQRARVRLSDAQAMLPLLNAAAASGCGVDLYCTRPHEPQACVHLAGAACWAVAAAAAAVGAAGRAIGGALVLTYHCPVVAASLLEAAGAGGGGDVVALARAAFLLPARQAAVAGGTHHGWLGGLLAGGGGGSGSCPTALAPDAGGGGRGEGKAVEVRVCRVRGWPGAPELCVKCDPIKQLPPEQQAWPCCSARVCFFGAHLAPLLGWLLGAAAGAWLACLAWRLVWRLRQRRQAAAVAQGVGMGKAGGRWGLLSPRRAGGGWLTDLRTGGGSGGQEAVPLLAGQGAPPLGGYGGAVEEAAVAAAAAASAAEEGGVAERPGIESMFAALEGAGAGAASPCGSPSCAFGAGCCGRADAGGAGGLHISPGRPDIDGAMRAAAKDAAGSAGGGLRGGVVYGVVVCGPESLQAAVRESADAGGAGGLRVRPGRPDIDGAVRAAAKDAAGSAGGGLHGGVVYGVVVCGPETLQAAVRESYGRHLERAFPGSWLRGFSFTT
ncbi:hypothetical protein TSOC_005222 [Tetrabaena socialis]|uniref:Uncharacterized protein n=1 Tax=Tetrabaena socialis TaxID=47790 RepID=A0A2J8A6R8_9CHLO|nr:hypothetical protein TSOC_005222 [Tetrabaena socialis]|eukprot:PNH08218.1 hypothetical protein TSOC_005222 [Tetrabaena socialis]